MKARVREMAAELIRIAAARAMKEMPAIETPAGLYDEFCARFPYAETEDQERAIADVIEDLAKAARWTAGLRRCRLRKDRGGAAGRFRHGDEREPGGRRRADHASARQHYRTFRDRFAGLPVRIAHSPIYAAKDAKDIKARLSTGDVILSSVPTRCSPSPSLSAISALIVDEEQHFGVGHKEQLRV